MRTLPPQIQPPAVLATVVTRSLAAIIEVNPTVGERCELLASHLLGQQYGDLAVLPDPTAEGWHPSFHLDDPTLGPPDLWTTEVAGINVWAKRDDHTRQGVGPTCSWCGHSHPGVMAVVTFELPADY